MGKTPATSLIIASLLISVTEAHCKFGFDGNGCISSVICPAVDDKVIPEKIALTIYYRNKGLEDIVAECDSMKSGIFSCYPADGFTCDAHPNRFFSIEISTTTHCITEGEFLFDASHQEAIRCNITKGRPHDYQNENGANPLPIGLGIGIPSLVVVAAVAAFLCKRNRQRLKKLWQSMAVRNDNDITSKDHTEAQHPLNPDEALQKEMKKPTDQEKEKEKMAVIDFHEAADDHCVTDRDVHSNYISLKAEHV